MEGVGYFSVERGVYYGIVASIHIDGMNICLHFPQFWIWIGIERHLTEDSEYQLITDSLYWDSGEVISSHSG